VKLRHLRYFVEIVEAGSFSRAAATIHVAQPALSQQIAELERELGVALLHRSARGVRTTAAGEAFHHEAVAILRQVEAIPGKVRSVGGETQGVVSLGMSSTLASFLAGPFMEICRSSLPKVTLRLITGDSMLLQSRIDAGTLDLAAVFEDEPIPGFARLPLFRQRLYLVGRGPNLSVGAVISLSDLAKRPLIMPAHPNVSRSLLDRVFAAAGLVPNIVAEADVLSSMLSAVQTGLGDTVLPKGDLSDVWGHGDLLPLPIEPPIHLTAAALSSTDVPLGRAAGIVRDLLAGFVFEQMRSAPPPGAEWVGEPPAISAAYGRIST
jgi:LysR family transcriptional regulator, nitrogen assimilation regulatory protein